MCYAKDLIPPPPVKLTRKEWTPILEVLDRYGLVEIRLGESGEPTIDEPLLTEFLIDAKKRGFYISLTTNGQFDSSWVDVWADLVDQPLFSIDGDRSYHDWNRGPGSFDKALKNLRLFSGKTKELRVNTILSRRTTGLETLIKHCVDCGVDELCLLQLRPYNKGKKYWEDVLTPEEWEVFIKETIPYYRNKYPNLRIRPDYDITGGVIIDRLVDKVWQCSAGVEAFGIRPYLEDDKRLALKIYGCGYLCDEGGPFLAAVFSPSEFREQFLELWHKDEAWEVFRNPKRCADCVNSCDYYGKTCFGKCTAMIRYAEINPDFEKYLRCPFSRPEQSE